MEAIFNEVVYIMHHDYAGWKDKQGRDNPENFLGQMKDLQSQNKLSKEVFAELVKDYLLDFNDKHIYFNYLHLQNDKPKSRGFQVRRFEDRLFVTNVDAESRLKRGMSFKTVGDFTIPELKERHLRLLNENHAERENWTRILSLYEYGELEDSDGNLHIIEFKDYEKSLYIPNYSVKELKENTLLITITDFMDSDAILQMIKENRVLLDTTKYWVIDVRVNYGGSDSSFYPLLPYLLPEEGVELADKEDIMLFNCTISNTERQLKEITQQLESIQDDQTKHFLKVFKQQWEKNKGKGFVEFSFEEFLSETFVKGKVSPESIVLLTDCMCGSSGDSFVEICKKSNKVIVMGRATSGLNDYSNLTSKKWVEGFELMYPTSRLSRIDHGKGMTGVGIQPHIYIPWSPKHLEVDVDMEMALTYLSQK